MRVQLLHLRENGIPILKHEIPHQLVFTGDLQIVDELEGGYNRVIKVAKFRASPSYMLRLLDVEIVWMNGNRMTLKGFEQKRTEAGVVSYAQSWLITVLQATSEPEDTERRYNERR